MNIYFLRISNLDNKVKSNSITIYSIHFSSLSEHGPTFFFGIFSLDCSFFGLSVSGVGRVSEGRWNSLVNHPSLSTFWLVLSFLQLIELFEKLEIGSFLSSDDFIAS
jgi:hypothetical protein